MLLARGHDVARRCLDRSKEVVASVAQSLLVRPWVCRIQMARDKVWGCACLHSASYEVVHPRELCRRRSCTKAKATRARQGRNQHRTLVHAHSQCAQLRLLPTNHVRSHDEELTTYAQRLISCFETFERVREEVDIHRFVAARWTAAACVWVTTTAVGLVPHLHMHAHRVERATSVHSIIICCANNNSTWLQ